MGKVSEANSKIPSRACFAFEDFAIDAVPALVVSQGQVFDVVRGNLSLSDALSLIHERGELKGKVL